MSVMAVLVGREQQHAADDAHAHSPQCADVVPAEEREHVVLVRVAIRAGRSPSMHERPAAR